MSKQNTKVPVSYTAVAPERFECASENHRIVVLDAVSVNPRVGYPPPHVEMLPANSSS